MSDFKVGDRVRVVKDTGNHIDGMVIGKEYKITRIDGPATLYELDNIFWVEPEEISMGPIRKKELLEMPMGTKVITDEEENNEYIYDGSDIFHNNDNDAFDSFDITDNLMVNDWHDCKIVEVLAPEYRTVYKKDEVKEMTIAEIEKELGYAVKIVKEEE